MKILFTERTVIAGMPEFKAGETYEVESELAHTLITRGVAEFAPEKEAPKPFKKSSKKL